MEREVIDVARTLGITLLRPISVLFCRRWGSPVFRFYPGFSRSISEFAAVIMFGGNLPGSTQVLASYVFTKVEVGELDMAVTAAVFVFYSPC